MAATIFFVITLPIGRENERRAAGEEEENADLIVPPERVLVALDLKLPGKRLNDFIAAKVNSEVVVKSGGQLGVGQVSLGGRTVGSGDVELAPPQPAPRVSISAHHDRSLHER